jgi:hypothetical protein
MESTYFSGFANAWWRNSENVINSEVLYSKREIYTKMASSWGPYLNKPYIENVLIVISRSINYFHIFHSDFFFPMKLYYPHKNS